MGSHASKIDGRQILVISRVQKNVAWEMTCGAHVCGTDRYGPLRMHVGYRDGQPHTGGSCRYLTCRPECCRLGTCVQTVAVSPYKYGFQCFRPWTIVRVDRKLQNVGQVCPPARSTAIVTTPLPTPQFGLPTTCDAHFCTIVDVQSLPVTIFWGQASQNATCDAKTRYRRRKRHLLTDFSNASSIPSLKPQLFVVVVVTGKPETRAR
jgi:hypothetical protein